MSIQDSKNIEHYFMIAKILGVSRPKVCRMLKICREKGIVQFNINTSSSHFDLLAQKIKNHFDLKEVIAVPSEASHEHAAGNMLVGMAWGSTLREMVREFQP